MREVLFRGKRTDNSEWVYGFYVKSQNYYTQDVSNAILSADGNHYGFGEYTFETYNEIDESTLGQYTGVTDKNGTKIFEDDIVKVRLQNGYLNYRVLFYYGMFRLNSLDDRFYIPIEPYEMEVIGNIYDNPELLGGENEINND